MQKCVLVCVAALFVAGPVFGQETTLDSVLVAAGQDRALAGRFYDRFLGTELFVPTWKTEGETDVRRRAGEGKAFAPVLIQTDEGAFMPAFDRLSRLRAWAEREISYIALPAHALVGSMVEQGNVHLAVNLGTDYYKAFSPEELAALQQSLAGRTETAKYEAGTRFMVGVPAEVPEGLLPALRAELSRNLEVSEAYLARLHVAGEEASGFALVLRFGADAQEHFAAIRQALGVASGSYVPDGEYLAVMPLGAGGIEEEMLSEIDPFYTREQ